MTKGDSLRRAILNEYQVEGVAAETLIDAICRTTEELALLERAVEQQGVLIDGARGQKVLNPALSGIARHRTVLGKLMQQAFPGEHESVSDKAARAARKRWHDLRKGD